MAQQAIKAAFSLQEIEQDLTFARAASRLASSSSR